MRELKFRAWLGEYKQYIYFGGDFKEQTGRWGKGRCTLAGNNHIAELYANEDNSNMFYQVHKVKCIEQYTGLKDKNGKEIYEGDIVTFKVEHFDSITLGFDSEEWRTAVVEWNQDDACYSFVDGDEPFSAQFEAEVIGNIHENPELLEHKG